MNKNRFKHDRMTSLRLPQGIYERLQMIADENWTNVSSVIRQGIRRELEAHPEVYDHDALMIHENKNRVISWMYHKAKFMDYLMIQTP